MNGIAVTPSPMEDFGLLRVTPEDPEMEKCIFVSNELPFSPEPVWLNGEIIFHRSIAFDPVSPIRVISLTEVDIDRGAMAPGTRYPFWLGDIYLIATKKDDGTIEFLSTE